MDNNRLSSSARITASACDACRGLFDMTSTRGFVVDGHGEDNRWAFNTRYIYTYIHHKMWDIMLFADAGCGLCKLIGARLNLKGPVVPIRAYPPASQCESSTQQTTGPNAAGSEGSDLEELLDKYGSDENISEEDELGTNEPGRDEPNKDEWELATLADFVKQKPGWNEAEDIVFHCNGRAVIQHSFDNMAEMEPNSSISLSRVIFPFEHNVNLYHFSTPYDPIDPHWEHRPSNDLLSKFHISLIDRWRDICNREHKSCKEITYDQPLPSRVLEIIGSVENKQRIRLVETRGKKQGAYACLSYCWGDLLNQAGQTTRLNLEQQIQEIPLHDLPSTVVDAIRLSYKLGFRYIWIDRLCIIQDDNQDWLEEASRMCEVYSRSALTISVPICTESSQSFLAERAKGFREQSRFATVMYAEATSQKHQRWFSRDSLSLENGPWFLEDNWRNLYNDPGRKGQNRWLSRGWTFQEWMLSPRVLHVDSMTLWDCFEGYANEMNCRNMTSANIVRNPSRLGKDVPWEAIVREYSRREITREEDRLPALAGLAERYAHVTSKTYLAGLWLEDLPGSLLWRRVSTLQPPRAWCAKRHAPSWSWCPLNIGVLYNQTQPDRDALNALASIRSSFCQYEPPGSFARVKTAWIDIGCRVSPVTKRYGNIICAGGKGWNTTPNYDYDHGGSDRNDVENVYLLLLVSIGTLCYGALIAKKFKRDDGRTCFRRLGVAFLFLFIEKSLEEDSQWEEQVVRLV